VTATPGSGDVGDEDELLSMQAGADIAASEQQRPSVRAEVCMAVRVIV